MLTLARASADTKSIKQSVARRVTAVAPGARGMQLMTFASHGQTHDIHTMHEAFLRFLHDHQVDQEATSQASGGDIVLFHHNMASRLSGLPPRAEWQPFIHRSADLPERLRQASTAKARQPGSGAQAL
jgi:hypothetical protein